MLRPLTILGTSLAAGPALAATKNPFSPDFYSLSNSDFIVLIAFLVFMGVLVYAKVPSLIAKQLDDRADTIRRELDEAKALREEAKALLASFERKHKDVQGQADEIVANARTSAEAAAEQAKADIARSVERRLATAKDQIASAEAAAVKSVRDEAVTVAVGAARDVLAKGMDPAQADALIDRSIETIDAKLH
ncbi:MAG: F0F1 ATP synthase subunit B [Shimia sp.]